MYMRIGQAILGENVMLMPQHMITGITFWTVSRNHTPLALYFREGILSRRMTLSFLRKKLRVTVDERARKLWTII